MIPILFCTQQDLAVHARKPDCKQSVSLLAFFNVCHPPQVSAPAYQRGTGPAHLNKLEILLPARAGRGSSGGNWKTAAIVLALPVEAGDTLGSLSSHNT